MNKAKVDEALQNLQTSLPEKPEWIILIRANGEFIARIGEYPNSYPQPLDDFTAALWTHSHGQQLLNTVDHLYNSGLVCNVTFAGNRRFLLLYLSHMYFLGMTFDIAISSIEKTIDSAFMYSYPLLEAVNPSVPD